MFRSMTCTYAKYSAFHLRSYRPPSFLTVKGPLRDGNAKDSAIMSKDFRPGSEAHIAVLVLVQPEMEKRRPTLVSIPPFGRGFSRHGVFRSDGGWAAQE